ncbi:hypothetical protein BG004_000424 [Podila humilis]|nr:hypothetical protein BG004_000424 [Podila humilis]
MAQMVHAPEFTPAASVEDIQGLRLDKGSRITYDAQSVSEMLDTIEHALDTTEDCLNLLPSLDQLSTLAGMHPSAWKPKFKWLEAAEFGQDLLVFFIKDIEGALTDPNLPDASKAGNVSSLMSCFNIIANALISNVSQGLSRLEKIQSRAMAVLAEIGQLGRTQKTGGVPEAVTNEIILTLSRSNPEQMYAHQPDAIKVLLRQFENPTRTNSAWKEAVAFTKQILNIWRPLLHPMVTREVLDVKSALMQARWTLKSQSSHMQDVLDIILLTIPSESSPNETVERSDSHVLYPWEGIAREIEEILQAMSAPGGLAANIMSQMQNRSAELTYQEHNSICNGHTGQVVKTMDSVSLSTLMSNLTFNILVLVGLATTQSVDSETMLIRLIKYVPLIPDTRLSIYLSALKEISASRNHFVEDYFLNGMSDDTDQDALLESTLGRILSLIRVFVSRWRALPNATKLYILAWGADMMQAVQQRRELSSGTKSWSVLKFSLSSNLHQLIAIAGADEDELIRGVIAAVFEQFIGAFGSLSLGPCLMSKMTDRSFDVSPSVGSAWRKVIFQSNPFAHLMECYDIRETDVIRALKMLILKSPNSGTFRHFHFTNVLSAFGSVPTSTDDKPPDLESRAYQDGDALQRLFHACQGKDILAKLNAESSRDMISWEHLAMIPNSLITLSYWSQWEAARYCMLSRLRTPFGGPQQTFDTLEKQLNGLLQQEQTPERVDVLRLTRLRNFTMLLDRLELQCYNASSGTALGVIPPAPRPSVVFFRTNKKVCEEWFSRIRSRVIQGSKISGEFDIVIRQSFMLLTDQFGSLSRGAVGDIVPWLDEFERTLVDLDPRYKNACLLDGQAFALGQINLDWMNTAVLRAQYRHEHSIAESTTLMESYLDLNSDSEVSPQAELLCQNISRGLGGLSNYQQLQAFMDSIPVDIYAEQTLPWSDDGMAQSLKEYCSDDISKSWRHLEEFYSRDDTRTSQNSLTLGHTDLYGQNFLFVSKVYQQVRAPPAGLDDIRQRAFDIVQSSTEFMLSCGMCHARSAFIDGMMLNTPVSMTPATVKEFMDFLSEVPDELKMNLLHKDLHQWARLDNMVNLAKTQTSTANDEHFRIQANAFKFLLSKIARRSECHGFASNIPRTWEGTLSPEIRFEEAKAAMAKHDYTTALRASSKLLQEFEVGSIALEDADSTAIFRSKILLKLAKWSRSTKPTLSAENLQTFENILGFDHDIGEHSSQARIEAITSGCLQKAVDLGSHYRKTWFAFGTHHYKQGWGILDDLGSFRLHHPVARAANENLQGILVDADVDQPEAQSKSIFCVFVKHCASGQPFDESTTYESIRTYVLSKLTSLTDPTSTVEAIVESFHTLLGRILESYRLAINGYFRFLQFATLEYRCNQPRSKVLQLLCPRKMATITKKITGEESAEEISQSAISDEITATLRLLRLLAKHGGQLYETFHENLTDINVGPWTNIIPQLFARLDHPETPVQSLIANLLCKIGEQSPQLIVFHCVVGANSAHNSALQRELLLSIGSFLTKSHPELVMQVQHLIRELERVTVLWEEVWCKKIMAVIPELKTTLQELTDQYQGLESIAGLGADDKDAVMSDNYQQSVAPILAGIESLQETHTKPETNHERWFVSNFGTKIRNALDSLRSPSAWSDLFEGLGLLKELCSDLNKELSGTRILQLSDLSPELSNIQSSLIDIPSHISGITIQSFEQQVVVIPTKTKPKKLTLIGSDGKRYTYLFKGLEDLHLDERVMQLLRISNGMLQRDKDSNARGLSARHYAVVPLSDSSGMIQWVESTVSLYTIIAKWQHRELVCARWMTDDNSTTPQGPQRATDIYHEKAAMALKKAGLPATHPRRQWPRSILLDVYHDMASETPADLLEREIWASSPTPAEWWRKSVRFARSTAVMSMIGYVIGLGDRHLDNILIDFTTGDLVHIDYNVCFEKGKRLRVPEVVPFRLTRNILTSFGVTGVEGNFRIGCEQTMKVMRKNKEILVTLLEAFVYDPLVDWQIEAPVTTTAMVGGGGGGSTLQQQQQQPQSGQSGQGINRMWVIQQGPGSTVFENESGTSTSSRSLTSINHKRLSDESIRSTTTTIGEDLSSKSLRSMSDYDLMSSTSLHQGQSLSHLHQQQPQQLQQPHHQRNAYAVNILRRVRHKLEGRDFDAVNKFKVSEQVDRVIQEATSVENLANIATKIAHGIRRGIDGLSPLSGLVPELRILIQEQKNVLTSLKRSAFEKEEAAKHLSIYGKTEGPDINDTLSKLSILILKAADLERTYANSLGECRELYKEIRVAEDENYSVRKSKLDLEQKIIATTGPSTLPTSNSTGSLASSSMLPDDKTIAKRAPELHKEMKLLRQETIAVENELEDMKRKKIKKASIQQLDALEKMGKELIVIAAYGKKIMSLLDDSPTPAGSHADERYSQYDGEAKTAYMLKACLDTFKDWSIHAPEVHLSDMDLGSFPRDNKQAMDAMLQDLAIKSGSDWYDLQSPSSSMNSSATASKNLARNTSISSVSSSSAASSQRTSFSSPVTIVTYVDGVPMVNIINEIPPTPESEMGPVDKPKTPLEVRTIFLGGQDAQDSECTPPAVPPKDTSPTSPPLVSMATTSEVPSTAAGTESAAHPRPNSADIHQSPFIPHSTYTPSTTYHPSQSQTGRNSPGHINAHGPGQSPPRSRPASGDYSSQHLPHHPLMTKAGGGYHSPQHHHQQQKQQYYHHQANLPTHMPIPMPVTMPIPMPVPHIPDQISIESSSSNNYNNGNKRHSQPISVSFPVHPPIRPLSSSLSNAVDNNETSLLSVSTCSSTTSSSTASSSRPRPGPRAPHAVLPPTEPGFRIPVGIESGATDLVETTSAPNRADGYDGPPPDYVENTMTLPSEKVEEKARNSKK